MMKPSSAPLARYVPSGENARALIEATCPVKVEFKQYMKVARRIVSICFTVFGSEMFDNGGRKEGG